jgi:hypothetical protein
MRTDLSNVAAASLDCDPIRDRDADDIQGHDSQGNADDDSGDPHGRDSTRDGTKKES